MPQPVMLKELKLNGSMKAYKAFRTNTQLYVFTHICVYSIYIYIFYNIQLLGYSMVCLGNRDLSVIFEIASKYCILDFSVDYDGYSISSKGFLPAVVDTMVI